ncbi:MAG: TetR/AcrR family transcriptional regulator [Myxococcales bacterium]|jgi:AcrR family transcriptional regulator
MPRSAKDNLEIRETRRDEILEAAKRVFAAKGFAGAKIAEIAAEAGFSHGLVYHYFESKQAILVELANLMMRQLDADLELSHPRAVDRVRAVIEQRRRELEDPLNPVRLVVQATLQGSLPESAKTELQAHFARFAKRQRRWIAEAQAAGDVDDTVAPDQIMKVLSYLLRGMCVRVEGQTRLPLPLPTAEAISQLLLPAPRRAAPRRKRPSKGQRKVS